LAEHIKYPPQAQRVAASVWEYQLWTYGLLIAYSFSYTIPPAALANHMATVRLLAYGWPVCAYVVISFAVVTASLFLAVLGPRVVKPGPLRFVRLLLVFDWLPHSYLALATTIIYHPGKWME